MAPPPAEPSLDRRGSKRSAPETTERGAKRRRDEEKENLRASTSSSSLESVKRPRKSTPAKIQGDLEQPLTTCSMKELLHRFQQRAVVDSRGAFLIRNVVQGRKVQARGSKVAVKKRKAQILNDTATRLMKANGTDKELFSVTFDRVMSWATNKEARIEKASTSLLQTYAVFVNENGIDEISTLGASVVPLVADRHCEEEMSAKRVFTDKMISYSSSKVVSVRCIYLVVVATRMVPKYEEGERRTRGTAIAGNEFVEETRYGCKLLLDADAKVNLLNTGLQHVILQNENDNKIFAEQNKTGWMKDLLHLKEVNKANKSTDDSNLPRVIIRTLESEDNEETPPPEKSSESPRPVQCPIRKTFFSSIDALKTNFQARYPCFTLRFKKNQVAETSCSNEYFGSDVNKHTQFFRKYSHRTVPYRPAPVKKSKRVIVEEDPDERANNGAPRNRCPKEKRSKSGTDFIQTPGQFRVMQVVYKNRTDSLLPSEPHPPFGEEPVESTSKPKKKPKKRCERNEVFPVNNSRFFCEKALHDRHLPIHEDVHKGRSGMQVAVRAVTREETVAYNKRLLDRYKTRNKQGKVVGVQHVPDVDPEDVQTPGVDFEGNPIPACAELSFAQQKSDSYNIYCRFYFAEAGVRLGACDAKFKSRALTGLIVKWYKEIFDEGLESIFLKHVQLVATTTSGWTREDTQKPLDKFKELRKTWAEQKSQKSQKTSV